MGSAQGAAGKVKVKEWHFAGTGHMTRQHKMAGSKQQARSAGEDVALWR